MAEAIDLLVVGGGPVGMAAGIGAAQAGMSVVIAEPQLGDIDKACGEGLMPAALQALDALQVPRPPGVDFVGIRYVSGSRSGAARFTMGPGLGVRRTALHAALRTRAEALGCRWTQSRITDWTEGADWVEAAGFRSRWMIAADGLQSKIRTKLNLGLPSTLPERLGVRRHFQVAPWSEFVDVHWKERAEAYITPVGPQTVGIGILFYPDAVPAGPGTPFDRLLTLFPEIAARLGPPCSAVAGAGPFAQKLRSRRLGRVLLVGDAAGYVDPLTGEGIRLGLDTASAAVDCILADTPERYDRAWRRATWRYRWVTTALLMLRVRPWLRRRMVPTVARMPGLLRRTLDFLNGP
jgi:flavin-dependent dehydrogenase